MVIVDRKGHVKRCFIKIWRRCSLCSMQHVSFRFDTIAGLIKIKSYIIKVTFSVYKKLHEINARSNIGLN